MTCQVHKGNLDELSIGLMSQCMMMSRVMTYQADGPCNHKEGIKGGSMVRRQE